MGTIKRDAAFERAFARLYPRARRLAYRVTGDAAVAEELAAEALARAFADWRRLSGVDYLDAWVLRVTTNLALNAATRRQPPLERPATVHPEDAVAVRLGLVAALQRLPQRQREAVALHYLGGLTDAEVGRALGVSTGTVKTHIHRALGSLRGFLADDEIEEGPVAYAVP